MRSFERSHEQIKFDTIEHLEELIPKQIIKNEYLPFKHRKNELEKLMTKRSTNQDQITNQKVAEKGFNFKGEKKLTLLPHSPEKDGKYKSDAKLQLSSRAKTSENSN